MPSLINNAAHWKMRARETRDLAATVTDRDTKQTLLKIAEEYEHLAERASARPAAE